MQNEKPALPPTLDRRGRTLNVGDPVILTGRVREIPGFGADYITVDLDGNSDGSFFSFGTPVLAKGTVETRVPGEVTLNAMREAREMIFNLQRKLDQLKAGATARETALRETIVQIVTSSRPTYLNGGQDMATPYSEQVACNLDRLIRTMEEPMPEPERKLTPQEAADIEFQAGRNCARAGQEMLDESSPGAREGYEYERQRAVRQEGGGDQ